MEQINQWFVGPFRFSYKTVVKDDCLEGTRARSRIIRKHPNLSIAHYFKTCCNLFWYGLKPALLISHTLVDHLI